MYKVAVVIPVYNVEQYIVKCAESLFNQTLEDMQFIFVDDASHDNSIPLLEQTLERFPKRKPHTIILHHPQNMGLPTSRATGLALVDAPYVAHCDSDDYVDPTMYAKLYDCAVQNDSDMVVCGRYVQRIDGSEYAEFDNPITNDSYISNFLYGRLSPYVWSRLTKTAIYRRVQFPVANLLEDWVQVAQLLTYSSRITFLNESLYHYGKNPLSISNDMNSEVVIDKMQQSVANYYLMHDFVVKHHNVKEEDFILKKGCIRRRFLLRTKQLNIRRLYLKSFPKPPFSILFHRKLPRHHKLILLLELLGLYSSVRAAYRFIMKVNGDIRSKQILLFWSATPAVSLKRPLHEVNV